MAIQAFLAIFLNQQVMPGGIEERPPPVTTTDAYLISGAAMTPKAVFVVTDMTLVRQFATRNNFAVVVSVNLDVVH